MNQLNRIMRSTMSYRPYIYLNKFCPSNTIHRSLINQSIKPIKPIKPIKNIQYRFNSNKKSTKIDLNYIIKITIPISTRVCTIIGIAYGALIFYNNTALMCKDYNYTTVDLYCQLISYVALYGLYGYACGVFLPLLCVPVSLIACYNYFKNEK